MNELDKLWQQQIDYNNKIRAREFPDDKLYWSKQYLLGVFGETGEVLDELSWKAHRKGHPINRSNLARELADMQKYMISLWEVNGFTADDMLSYVTAKGHEMELQRLQDFESNIPAGAPIVITDIDGTLGDWRKAFSQWVKETHGDELKTDDADTLAIEVNLGLTYPRYAKLKEQFEAEGGYNDLPAYPEVRDVMLQLYQAGVYIIAYTARPARKHSRIWADSWAWLETNLYTAAIRELHIGAEERISCACELAAQGHPVMLLEDDPSLALRASHTGLQVLMRAQPYNSGISARNITRVNSFNADTILQMFETEGIE